MMPRKNSFRKFEKQMSLVEAFRWLQDGFQDTTDLKNLDPMLLLTLVQNLLAKVSTNF
jgi:hypothetical protein